MCVCEKHNLIIKKCNYITITLFYVNGENVIKMIFFSKIYHNWLTNLNISKNIKQKCTLTLLTFHGTYTLNIKLLYKFRIVNFYFFISNISIMPILLKREF